MRARHTPGPWKAVIKETVGGKDSGYMDRYRVISDAPGYEQHPWVLCDLMDYPSHTGKANADLLATAPLMLEALEGMVREFSQKFNVKKDYHKMVAFEAAKTAIRQAKGEE